MRTRAVNTPMNTGMIQEVMKKIRAMTMTIPSSSQAPIPPRTSQEGSVSRAAVRVVGAAGDGPGGDAVVSPASS